LNDTCDTESHPLHQTNVATLPCESQNTENACEQRSAFYVNYDTRICASNCIDIFIKYTAEPEEKEFIS